MRESHYCNCRDNGGGLHDPGPGCFAAKVERERIERIIKRETQSYHTTLRHRLLAAIREENTDA